MRNLRVASVESRKLALSPESQEKLALAVTDASRGQIVCATTSGSLICISHTTHQVTWSSLLFPTKELVRDNIVGLEFMMENEILVVGMESGELFSVSVPTQSVEVVGNVEGGIMQMSASPDGELLAIATGLGMLLLMTSDWEVFYEISLHDDTQLEACGPLRMSWRLDGKYFATVDGGTKFSSVMKLRIWERDTGTLHSCSKAFPSNSLGLDWIPNGSRLASVQNQDSAARIIFFERNGLERGSFDIKGLEDASVECIKWSYNSELFAVSLKCGQFDAIQIWSSSNYHWYLKQEWHYSKENDIKFGWDPEKPMCLYTWTATGIVQLLSLCWDSAVTGDSIALVVDGSFLLITPLALGIIPPPMSFFQLKFCTSICTVSLHRPVEGGSLVAASLCSGAISLLALPSVEKWDALEGLQTIIPDALFLEHTERLPCMRLLSWSDSDTLVGVVSSDCNGVPLNSDSLWPPWEQPHYSRFELILELEIYRGKESVEEAGLCKANWSFKCIKRTVLDKRVLAIAEHPSKEGILIHFEDGSFASYVSKRGLVNDVPEISSKNLAYPSLWIQPLVAPASQVLVLIGLDERGKLQVDSHIITKECTSFVIHRACINGKTSIHMLHTTKQDVLLIYNVEEVWGAKGSVRRVEDLSAFSSKTDEKLAFGHGKQGTERARTLWERGARLVTAVGGGSAAVILQTIRGNLETIYPSNLVIGSVIAALCESKFNEAVLLARRHHINLNIIVDFQGWELFVQRSVDFVRQVQNLNHVTELVCAVGAGNLAENLYQDLLPPSTTECGNLNSEPAVDNQPKHPPAEGTKVQLIMHALRKALESEVIASPKRELCILTTMARSNPPELEEALVRIKRLREEEMNQLIQEDDMNHSMKNLSSEEALKHLLWLSDSKSVFDAALGLYDLHLAAMVAANSQGDPKEFLPLLQELEKMPLPVMKFTIDHKLQRFESALTNLAAAGSSHFSRCLELIRDHPNLFPIGKHLFQAEPERMAVLEAWGDYLLAEERFEDAAAAFTSCLQLHKALGAYRAGGMWQCVLVVAGVLGYAQEEVLRLAQELREELQALGRPGDAARIAVEHCKDPEDAVGLYVEAQEWTEAVRVSYMCEEAKSMLNQIQSAALECASSYTMEFQEGLEKVGKYHARFLAVKQRRLLLEMKLKMGRPEDVEDDAASDVTSHVSDMSVYTTGTRSSKLSKQSSARDRKQGGGKSRGGRIRAGSPGEEAALLEHLKGMKITDSTLEGIQKLLQILILFRQNGVAEKLQHLVFQFQSSQRNAVLEADGSCGDDTRKSQWAIEVLGIS